MKYLFLLPLLTITHANALTLSVSGTYSYNLWSMEPEDAIDRALERHKEVALFVKNNTPACRHGVSRQTDYVFHRDFGGARGAMVTATATYGCYTEGAENLPKPGQLARLTEHALRDVSSITDELLRFTEQELHLKAEKKCGDRAKRTSSYEYSVNEPNVLKVAAEFECANGRRP